MFFILTMFTFLAFVDDAARFLELKLFLCIYDTGGDQGLLNSYFSDWAHGDINKHLPFLYNVTSAAFYSYIPALKQYVYFLYQ